MIVYLKIEKKEERAAGPSRNLQQLVGPGGPELGRGAASQLLSPCPHRRCLQGLTLDKPDHMELRELAMKMKIMLWCNQVKSGKVALQPYVTSVI